MTIDEAIKLLRRDIDDPGSVDIIDLNRAEELGSEALIRLKDARFDQRIPYTRPLPGETEE